jgi:KAP family P-loop domain
MQSPQEDTSNAKKNNDLFEREKFIKQIHPIVNELLKIGGAVAIHAPFGMGKTWVCEQYIEYLNRESSTYSVAKIDAFLHDYMDEPFIPIHQAISNILGEGEDIESLKAAGKEILKVFTSSMIRLIPVVGDSASKVSDTMFNTMLNTSVSLEEKIIDYKKKLETLAKNKKIVIFINELDRCRPEYALLLLERTKHYFEIPNVLFVLMINQEHIASIIKHKYGSNREQALMYLEKFLVYPVINLPLISENERYWAESNTINLTNTRRHYEYLFSKSEYSTLFKIEEINNINYYLNNVATFSICMDLNYREHKQLCLATAILKDKFLSKKNIQNPFLAYIMVLYTKYPDILEGLKELKIDAHEDA